MSADEFTLLREHLELQIRQERELREGEQAHISHALELQAVEYERRLKDLNNAAAVLQGAVAANVSHDTWIGFRDRYDLDQQRKNDRFDKVERFQNKLLGAFALVAVVLPLAVGIIVYVLTRHALPVQAP